jgi:hypothetical protein
MHRSRFVSLCVCVCAGKGQEGEARQEGLCQHYAQGSQERYLVCKSNSAVWLYPTLIIRVYARAFHIV